MGLCLRKSSKDSRHQILRQWERADSVRILAEECRNDVAGKITLTGRNKDRSDVAAKSGTNFVVVDRCSNQMWSMTKHTLQKTSYR